MGEEEKGKKKQTEGSLRSIFMHADVFDVMLMMLGFIGSIGDGLTLPVTLFVTGRLMNNIGDSSNFGTTASFSHTVNK
ncbi:hypothetical protein Dimus_033353, partial [Dionaea muscipula]